MNIFLIIISSLLSIFISRKIYSRLTVLYPDYNLDHSGIIYYISAIVSFILQSSFLDKIVEVNFINCSNLHKIFLIMCFISTILISSCLAVSCVIDWFVYELPDETNLIILLSMIPLSLYLNSGKSLLTGIIIFIIYFALSVWTNSFGMGDVKLAVALAIGLKLSTLFKFIFLSFLFASIFSIIKMVVKRADLKSEIAFGPYIALSFIILFII